MLGGTLKIHKYTLKTNFLILLNFMRYLFHWKKIFLVALDCRQVIIWLLNFNSFSIIFIFHCNMFSSISSSTYFMENKYFLGLSVDCPSIIIWIFTKLLTTSFQLWIKNHHSSDILLCNNEPWAVWACQWNYHIMCWVLLPFLSTTSPGVGVV